MPFNGTNAQSSVKALFIVMMIVSVSKLESTRVPVPLLHDLLTSGSLDRMQVAGLATALQVMSCHRDAVFDVAVLVPDSFSNLISSEANRNLKRVALVEAKTYSPTANTPSIYFTYKQWEWFQVTCIVAGHDKTIGDS